MPYKDDTARRLASRERQRRWRERQKEKKKVEAPVVPLPVPDDPVGALAAWARDELVVPCGHPAAGQPMALPDYAEEFLRAGWGAHESACSVARKNAKSAACAILMLGLPCRASPGIWMAGGDCFIEQREGLRTQKAGCRYRHCLSSGRDKHPAFTLSGSHRIGYWYSGHALRRQKRRPCQWIRFGGCR